MHEVRQHTCVDEDLWAEHGGLLQQGCVDPGGGVSVLELAPGFGLLQGLRKDMLLARPLEAIRVAAAYPIPAQTRSLKRPPSGWRH